MLWPLNPCALILSSFRIENISDSNGDCLFLRFLSSSFQLWSVSSFDVSSSDSSGGGVAININMTKSSNE